MRSSASCRYSAGIPLYSAHTGTIRVEHTHQETALSALDKTRRQALTGAKLLRVSAESFFYLTAVFLFLTDRRLTYLLQDGQNCCVTLLQSAF